MSHHVWNRIDRIMRWLHLYTGLFLMPWVVVYAASAFCLNHGPAINSLFHIQPPGWELLREEKFTPGDSFPAEPAEQANVILQHLGLDGPHRIQGKPTPAGFTIFRLSGSGHYRIRWARPRSLLVVERQKNFSYIRLVHFLHFRCGYQQPYVAYRLWAAVVDFVAFSMVLWVVSGIYIWWRMPRKRRLGSIVVLASVGLFAGLVIYLCS